MLWSLFELVHFKCGFATWDGIVWMAQTREKYEGLKCLQMRYCEQKYAVNFEQRDNVKVIHKSGLHKNKLNPRWTLLNCKQAIFNPNKLVVELFQIIRQNLSNISNCCVYSHIKQDQ